MTIFLSRSKLNFYYPSQDFDCLIRSLFELNFNFLPCAIIKRSLSITYYTELTFKRISPPSFFRHFKYFSKSSARIEMNYPKNPWIFDFIGIYKKNYPPSCIQCFKFSKFDIRIVIRYLKNTDLQFN